MTMNKEQFVVGMINGEVEVPKDLAELVGEYREYASLRGECVSFPRKIDEKMNYVFDLLVECA